MKRRIIAVLLISAIIMALSGNIVAASTLNDDYAYVLNALGMFKGSGNGYELEQPCDRLMGAVLLVRFLGQEKEALNEERHQPFSDVVGTYADKYITYLNSQGLIQGVSKAEYGTGIMTADQFATLMLRALGYKDNIDFKWDASLKKLSALGAITSDESANLENKEFLRNDAVFLCYKTLFAKLKDGSNSLVNKLLYQDVFTTTQLNATKDGALMLAADMPDLIYGVASTSFSADNNVKVNNIQELKDLLVLNMKNNCSDISIYAPGITKDELQDAVKEVDAQYCWDVYGVAVDSVWNGFVCVGTEPKEYFPVELYYKNPSRYQKNYQFYDTDLIDHDDEYLTFSELIDKINEIDSKIITANMTEKEKVKAVHDWLCLNTKYKKTEYLLPHMATTAITKGYAVCDGYAGAFKMLLNGAGIDCKVIYGTSGGYGHAWNQVKIDDKWYNVDVTWDDPDSGNYINYDYFCKSDTIFSKEHTPDSKCSPETCPKSLD
ncbi:MAG: transglutaminase domain-containing protein [Bacillota bacterium]|nr:transglutaminase domain-containing protein [Bacillota bacterium]